MNQCINAMFVALIFVGLQGCGGNTKQQSAVTNDPYPAWYYDPGIEAPGALNAASCIEIHGNNMDLAKKQAAANGKTEIAGQIETKIKAMDKTYDRLATTEQGTSAGGTFESVSKQIVNQTLSGVTSIKSARVVDKDAAYLCTLSSLSPEKTSDLISQVIKVSKVNLSAADESVLREQFNAYKAQQELDQELQKRQQ